MKDFLAELKAGEIAEMVLLKPETSPEDLNSSSVMDEDVLEGFTKQRATRLRNEIFKNPEDPVYPLVKGFSDVASKHPPSQLPPDRGVRHEIDVPSTKYCAKTGVVQESKSLHSTPTFCVRKPNGKHRSPITRKDVLLNNMSGCTLYSALDLVDGYYQILMQESDIPLTAVSTPSGMIWEWLVMPQGLLNAPVMFNRLVIHSIVQTIAVGVRADPGKVRAIAAWLTPRSQKDLRKWLGLANYLHKYSAGYAELARPLSDLLKKDADWVWEQQHQDAFDSIKASLQQAPDDEGRERVISFQSKQLKAAERNYPVHDKEVLAMNYALVRV
ncbi:Pol protein [Phytophthora palmivora]|uniref:Pol protein n=1 Tax=Phytophthora palmivora TaxID=4796 RepID=A0A2P4XB96_9STRA|nr:Pol protein [Phytophthora palmivora]